MELISGIIMLVIIMDPFGNLVVINGLLSQYDKKPRQKIILRESLIAFIILIICALMGNQILHFLGLEQPKLFESLNGTIWLFDCSSRHVYLYCLRANLLQRAGCLHPIPSSGRI